MSVYRAFAVILLGIAIRTFAAAPPATAPTTRQNEHLSATITAVKGLVEVRDNDEQPWRKATVGMVVGIGAEFRTGPRSGVVFRIPPDQVVTVDRLGVVKILEAMRGKTIHTDLGMKYGRVKYETEAAGLEHESTIRSPSNALAIRGCNGSLFEDAFDSWVELYEGQGWAHNRYDYNMPMGTGEHDSYGNGLKLGSNDESSAQHSLLLTTNFGAGSNTLGGGEANLFGNFTNYNNTNTGLQSGLRTFRTGPSGSNGGGTLPSDTSNGVLSFNLSWTGDNSTGVVPDLDLFVMTPKGETLVPGSQAVTTASGAIVSKNNHGHGDVPYFESVTWDKSYTIGKYLYGVEYKDKNADPGIYTLNVLLNGTKINGQFQDIITELDQKITFTIDVPASTSTDQTGPKAQAANRAAKPAANRPVPAPAIAPSPQPRAAGTRDLICLRSNCMGNQSCTGDRDARLGWGAD